MKEMVGGCCVCSDERGWKENPLVYCDGVNCNVAVHQACYGIIQVPTGPWFCRRCESQERIAKVRCELCPSKDGALKRTDNGGWAHVVCSLYIPEVRFGNVTTMEPIVLELVPAERFHKTCYICEQQGKESKASIGACMECNKVGCKNYFHVTCAQAAGLLCEEAGNFGDNVKYCGYCSYHYQKLKKDNSNIKTIPAFKPISSDSTPESSPDKKNSSSEDFAKIKKKPKLSRTNGIESDGFTESEKDTPKKPEKKRKKMSIESGSPSPSREPHHRKSSYSSDRNKDGEHTPDPTPSFTAMYDNLMSKSKDSDETETEDDEPMASKKPRGPDRKKKSSKPVKSKETPKSKKAKTKKIETQKSISNGEGRQSESTVTSSKSSGSSASPDEKRETQRDKEKSRDESDHNKFTQGNNNTGNASVQPQASTSLTNNQATNEFRAEPSPPTISQDRPFPPLSSFVPPPPTKPKPPPPTQSKDQARDGPQTLEQLLESQWASSTQFIMDEAAHFDVASLLACLHKLRKENERLEEQLRGLSSRRDHLVAVNSRLSLPLNDVYGFNGDGLYAGAVNCPPFLRGLDKR